MNLLLQTHKTWQAVERKLAINNCCPLTKMNKHHHCLHAGKRSYAKRLTSDSSRAQTFFSEDVIIQPRSCPLSNTGPVQNAGPLSNSGVKFIGSGSRRDNIHTACAFIKLFHGDRGEPECAPDNRASSSAACLSSRRQWSVKRVQALLLLPPTLLLLHKTSLTSQMLPAPSLTKKNETPFKQSLISSI